MKESKVQSLLRQCSTLLPWHQMPSRVSQSRSKTHFLSPYANNTRIDSMTHYKRFDLPVDWENISRPSGFKWLYYDQKTSTWASRVRAQASFNGLCSFRIPTTSKSPFAKVPQLETNSISANGLCSNEIISRKSSCPTGLNPH